MVEFKECVACQTELEELRDAQRAERQESNNRLPGDKSYERILEKKKEKRDKQRQNEDKRRRSSPPPSKYGEDNPLNAKKEDI